MLSLVPIQAICSTIPITSSDTTQIQQNCMVTILGPQQECDLTSYLDQFYPQLLTEENNYADAIAACKGDEVTYTALTDHPFHCVSRFCRDNSLFLFRPVGGHLCPPKSSLVAPSVILRRSFDGPSTKSPYYPKNQLFNYFIPNQLKSNNLPKITYPAH